MTAKAVWGRGTAAIVCAAAPPLLFVVAIWSAASGASDIFYLFLLASLAATAAGVVLAVQVRRREPGGWFVGIVAALAVGGVLGYGPWAFVVFLDAAARSGSIGP